MSDDTKSPPWPKHTDTEAKSRLASWVEDQLADTHYDLYHELHGGEPELDGLLSSEQALLVEAFETKKWSKVAARLREPGATRAFVGVVADLIELNAMKNGAKLSRHDNGKFRDSYTHLKRREDVVAVVDWTVINHVLSRSYPEMQAKGKGKEVEWMASWLTAVLRGTEPGKTDEELYRERIGYIEKALKTGKDKRRNRLARLVHAVRAAIAIDD